ncbi:MAG: HAD-IIIA family hydrolase [Bacteroidia bacterium]|nr:MAG: HAD-IIIA family hydrolase [Bacteroidia bacterium]
MTNYKQLLSDINTFIFDVDGVMTSGIVLLNPGGEMLRSMNVKDGYALQLAVRKGYRIIIITGGSCEAVKQRFELLGIHDVYLGVSNKLALFEEIVKRENLDRQKILYMGDDIPDYKVMREVGVPACPADAVEEIKAISKYISSFEGGKGCARDVLEQVMRIQDNWFDDDGFHW